uniref:organ-specific protein S2-like isoform X1 n=1 Tax=Erigeron canadensis TaxID=72917 RepID=UPI001CB97E6A|nr:organ-specific protein S2-like isoform X1 [Erigeron canadensis]
MESSPIFFTLVISLIMIAINIVDGRIIPGEYYMQDSLVQGTSVSAVPMKKSDCDNLAKAYDNDTGLKGKKKTDKEFEPKPNVSIYYNGMNLKGKKTSYDKKFEPRSNFWAVYGDDENLKGAKKSQNDFEPRPNISVYDNGMNLKDKKTSLDKDFVPRPNGSVYGDDENSKGAKMPQNDFEPRQNVYVKNNA